MPSTRQRILGIAALAAVLLLPCLATAAHAGRSSVLFTLTDPQGDDHGDGMLLYPGRPEFDRGDLDLLELTARATDEGTLFEAVFAQPIRVPQRTAVDATGTQLTSLARYGFYTFNLDIYIDMDRTPGSGAVQALPGRRVQIAPENAWERAICLTPRPHEARSSLKRMVIQKLATDLKETTDRDQIDQLRVLVPEEMERRVFFPTQVRVSGSKISFLVPAEFLGGAAKADWSYVVAVSGSDLLQTVDLTNLLGRDSESQNLMLLGRQVGRSQDFFGGAREDDELQPPLVDIIVPNGLHQEKVLRDYDLRSHRPVELIGVIPAEPNRDYGPTSIQPPVEPSRRR